MRGFFLLQLFIKPYLYSPFRIINRYNFFVPINEGKHAKNDVKNRMFRIYTLLLGSGELNQTSLSCFHCITVAFYVID